MDVTDVTEEPRCLEGEGTEGVMASLLMEGFKAGQYTLLLSSNFIVAL